MKDNQNKLSSRIKSFKHAGQGLKIAYQSEANFRIHVLAIILVIILGVYFSLNYIEWVMILCTIGMVLITELLNTAIEFLCDKVEPNYDSQIKSIKDLAASAVLVASIISVAIAGFIFLPKIWAIF